MQFLKNFFDLNNRLSRSEYLLFGILLSILWISILSQVHSFYLIRLLITLYFFFILGMSIKRGRDSGLSGITTLVLFFLIPIISLNVYIFNAYSEYLALLFILYLLLMPSSQKEIKQIRKIEFISLNIIIFLLLLLVMQLSKFLEGNGSCRVPNFTCINMRGTSNALKMFKLDNGTYPTTKEGLNALIKNPNPKKYPNYASSAYLEKFPHDGWGNPILYIHLKTDKGDNFQLIGLGADGKYGGEEEYRDIIYPDSCK